MCLINKEKVNVDVFSLNHHMMQALRCHHKNKMMILLQNHVSGRGYDTVISRFQDFLQCTYQVAFDFVYQSFCRYKDGIILCGSILYLFLHIGLHYKGFTHRSGTRIAEELLIQTTIDNHLIMKKIFFILTRNSVFVLIVLIKNLIEQVCTDIFAHDL